MDKRLSRGNGSSGGTLPSSWLGTVPLLEHGYRGMEELVMRNRTENRTTQQNWEWERRVLDWEMK